MIIEAKRPDSGNPIKSMVIEGKYATTKMPAQFWANWRGEDIADDVINDIKNFSPDADI